MNWNSNRFGGVRRALVFAAITTVPSCDRPPVRSLDDTEATITGDWARVFTGGEVQLQLPAGSRRLSRVSQVVVGRTGELFIPDPKAGRVLIFGPHGSFVRGIRTTESGPAAVRLLAAIALDDKDNLFIYDAIDQRITVLRAPDYEAITHQFQIPSPLSSFIALPTGAVVTFFPAGDHVFTKYDAAGRKAASADLRLDKKLRVFHGRIQTGSVITSGTRDLFGVHPASFSIVRMSPGLRILEFFKGKRGDKWAPRPDRFPADLNPYGFKRGHELWWNGFTHIGRLYSLTGNHLLLSMFKSMGLNQEQSFVNVYDVNGRVLARGLAVPHSALVVGAGDSRVFLARNVRLNADESVDPLHFYSYRLTYRDVTQ